MKNRAGNTIPLAVLVVAAIASGGIFWWSWSTDQSANQNNQNQGSNSNTNTTVVSTRSYTNEQYDFTFLYPRTGYVVKEYSNIFEVRLIEATNPDLNKPRYTDGMPGPGAIGLSRLDTLSTDLNAFAKTQTGLTATPTTTTIDSLTASHIMGSKTLNGGQVDIDAYFFNYGGKTWSLRMDLDGVAGELTTIYQRIVSSLNFSDTLSYSNSTYHYTFDYDHQLQVTSCGKNQNIILATTTVTCDTDASFGVRIAVQSGVYNESSTITATREGLTNPVQSTVTIDGISATRLKGVNKPGTYGEGYWTDMVFLKKGTTSFIITNYQKTQTSAALNKIISSLNFTQ